jgi:nitrogenase-associated protein
MSDTVVFYEKPGCLTNMKQKEVLRAFGYRLDVRNLLAERWSPERLRPFFGDRPVAEWLNPTAPRVKSGEVRPQDLDEAQALALMVADPLLIRRPLMETGAGCCSGFEPSVVLALLGVEPSLAEGLQSCSKPGTDAWCEPPGAPRCR